MRRFGTNLSDTGAHFVAHGGWQVILARKNLNRWRLTVLAGPGRPRYGSSRDVVVAGVVQVVLREEVAFLSDGGELGPRVGLVVVIGYLKVLGVTE